MDRRRPRQGPFTGYPFTGIDFSGYPFTGVQLGEDTNQADLAFIFNGGIPYYTTYTREDPAYTSSGTFEQDEPPFEIIDGEKRFVQYGGTNLALENRDITNAVWLASVNVINYNTFQASAQFQVLRQSIATLDGESYTYSFKARIPDGCTANEYRMQHVGSASGSNTNITITTTISEYEVTVLGAAGGGNVDFGIQDNNLSDWETMHKAMAVLYRPVTLKKGDRYQIEEYTAKEDTNTFKDMPLDVVMGCLVFFWSLNNELLQITLKYLAKEMGENLTTQQRQALEESGVGINQSMAWLKEMLPNSTTLLN